MIGLLRMRFVIALYLVSLVMASCGASAAGPDTEDLREIHKRLEQVNLPTARVVLGRDGRVELVGEYRNRSEVQIAFSVAQSVVGVKWVAPTTPENIKYPVEGMAEALRAHMRNIPTIRIPSMIEEPVQTPSKPTMTTPVEPNRYALVVGIGEFQDARIQRLKYTAKDAEDIYRYLITPAGGGFQKQNVTLLTNRQATRRAVEEALDNLAARVRPGDTVLIYISSHGAPLNDRENMNIVMYDTRPKPRHDIFLTSLTDEKLSQTVRALDAARLLIVLDTCYSGAAYAKVPEFLATGAKDLLVEEDREAVQGIPSSSLKYLAKGGKDLLVETTPAVPSVPQSAAPPAKVLISASDASEKSWESEQLRNSFFTYYLLDGIRKYANVHDAYAYAKPAVSTAVKREKGATQTPQAVFLPAEVDFQLTNRAIKGNPL